MSLPNVQWVSILGTCEVVDAKIEYLPQVVREGVHAGTTQFAMVKSNVNFENGSITFKATIGDESGKVQLCLSHQHQIEIFCGLNNGNAAYGVSTFTANKWENFLTAGWGNPPPINTPITIRVKVKGSNVTVFVNDVEVLKGSYPVRKSQIAFLLGGKEKVTLELLDVTPDQSIAFVVMQFTDEFDSLFDEVIAPVCASFELKADRAKDIYNNGLIVDDITQSIRDSSMIIADITPNNPNVYYEVGYAHGLQKPTILLAEKSRQALPFDISGFRTIFYDNTIGGKAQVEDRLRRHIDNILNSN